jgi:methyl-accepting chemotaxis protein
MTSIRTKIFIPISILALILIVLNSAYIYWVYSDFEERKKIMARDNVSRFEQTMQDKMSHTRYLIDSISKDRTVIESIELGTQYTAYATLNIIFKQENFDELRVYSNDGEIFHNARVEESFGKRDTLYTWLVSLKSKQIIECVSNYIDSYPSLLCAKAIHSINGLVGFVVAGYYIDESFISSIEDKLKTKLKVSRSSNLNYDQNININYLKNLGVDRQIEPFNIEVFHDFSKIDEESKILEKFAFVSITLSILIILFSWFIFTKIANKILTLTQFANKFKRRDFNYKIKKNKESSNDEIDQISSSFYEVASSYSDFSDICTSIANGNIQQKIKVQSEKDNLGFAINKMVDSLRRLEKENKDKLLNITTINKKLELASKEKSYFVATMSHEIRTPLNGILGMIETIKDDNLSSAQINQLLIARRNGNQLVQILDDILDFSKN